MPQSDFLFVAELDNALVLKSIKEMETRAKEFEKSGDSAMKAFGKSAEATADYVKVLWKAFQIDPSLGEHMAGIFGKPIKTAEQFRAGVKRLFRDIVEGSESLEDMVFLDFDKLIGDAALQKFQSGAKIGIELGVDRSQIESQIQSIRDLTDELLESNNTRLAQTGEKLRVLGEYYYDAFQKGASGVEQTQKDLGELIKKANSFRKELESFTEVTLTPTGGDVTRQQMDDIAKTAQTFLNSADSSVQDFGRKTISTLIKIEEQWAEQPDDIETISRTVSGLNTNVNKYAASINKAAREQEKLRAEQEKAVKTEAVEPIKIQNSLQLLDELKQKATDFMQSATDEGQEFGEDLYNSLSKIEDAWNKQEIGVDTLKGSLTELNTQVNQYGQRVSTLSQEDADLEKQFNIHKAIASIKELDEVVALLLSSTKQEARDAGATFGQMRDRIKDAFQDPNADAVELQKETQRLTTEARKLARAYSEDVVRGANKAGFSAWKLGHALDRVGIRGAGGVLRIVDAFKGLNPAMTVALAGFAAIALAINKLIQVVVQLEKAMIRSFINITKQAVEVAASYETIERQLTNIFKGQEELVERTLSRILDLSVDFGVDLTGEFSKVFLPLVDSFDQFERLAEFASTLTIAFDKDAAQMARAFGQAIAGRYRSIQDQFKLLASDIEVIKRFQEMEGAVDGFVSGMLQFFERTGQEWDTYENTLRRVLGSLDNLKNKLLLTLGEPIRNEIVEQLQRIIDWVDKNEIQITAFLTTIGNVVSDLVEKAGDTVEEFLEAITSEDFAVVEAALMDLASAAEGLVDALAGTDKASTKSGMNFILKASLALVKILEGALQVVTDIVELLRDTKLFTTVSDIATKDAARARKQAGKSGEEAARAYIEGAVHELAGAFDKRWEVGWIKLDEVTEKQVRTMIMTMKELGLTTEEAKELLIEYGFSEEQLQTPILDVVSGLEAELRALEASNAEKDEAIDKIFEMNRAQQDFLDTQAQYLDQVEEVRDAERALAEEMGKRFSEIFIATMNTDIDARIAEVGNRIRIEQEKIANLETLEWQIINVDQMNLDQAIEFGKMQIAGLQDEIDEVLDYITSRRGSISEEELRRLQMEIDFKRRLIQLEQDHIDKIADLQNKRRQDEEDAATDYYRREDEIHIKHNRRFIELELEHSRKVEKEERAHQNRLREIRMRADFDAQEAIRMNDAVALLRIRRRMEFDLQMEEEKNKERRRTSADDARDRRDELNRQLQYELEDLERANDQKLEDIAINFKRQLELIEENYQRQLREQGEQEKAKREDMLIWLKSELDDFKDMWDEKNAAHEEKWKDFYALEEKYISMVEARRQQLFDNFRVGPMFGIHYGTPADPTFLTPPGAGIGAMFGGYPGSSLYGGIGFPGGAPPAAAGPTDSVSPSLRQAVLNLAYRIHQAGQMSQSQLDHYHGAISSAQTNTELRRIQDQLRVIAMGASGPLMHSGGLVTPGHSYVKESDEAFYPTRAGVLVPQQREYMPGMRIPSQTITNDYSRNIDADISLLDPTHFTPVQRTVIRSIVVEEMLKQAVE